MKKIEQIAVLLSFGLTTQVSVIATVLSHNGSDYAIVVNDSRRVVNLVVSPDACKLFSSATHDGFQITPQLSKHIYDQFEDNFDFIIFQSDQVWPPTGAAYGGQIQAIQNDTKGIGLSIYNFCDSYGSSGKLQCIIHLAELNGLIGGAGLHEIMHRWGNFLNSIPGLGSHWGFSSVNGQLGGWQIDTLQYLGNGQYSANNGQPGNWFDPSGNAGNKVPYMKLELYLMGLVPIQEVPDIEVAIDASFIGTSRSFFTASGFKTITSADIVAIDGTRIPDYTASQKDFKTLFVVVTSAPLSEARFDYYDSAVRNFSKQSPTRSETGFYNFWEATGGRATMEITISPEDVKGGMKPSVTAQPSAGLLNLSWADIGYRLQSSESFVTPSSWSDVLGPFRTNNGIVSVSIPMDGDRQFFRLAK
ncbi:MAG: hypothetical protein AAB595_00280 [Patescibacteria group bacterium]